MLSAAGKDKGRRGNQGWAALGKSCILILIYGVGYMGCKLGWVMMMI